VLKYDTKIPKLFLMKRFSHYSNQMSLYINTSSSQTFYTLQIFNPSLYSYLQFDCLDDTPEPSTEETAYR